MTLHKVGYLIGSLAKGSINRKLAKALVRLAPPELVLSEISFTDLPLYSYDYDADYPPAGKAFKAAIAAVDAVLFVTPEYNRSIPGGLKNAIDWASRPYGANSFARKPSAVIGTSPGAIGTAVAQQNLRSVLGFCELASDECPGSLYPVHAGTDNRRRRGYERRNRRFSTQLHVKIPHLHCKSSVGATEGRLIVIHANSSSSRPLRSPVCGRRKEGPIAITLSPKSLLRKRGPAFASALKGSGNPSVWIKAEISAGADFRQNF